MIRYMGRTIATTTNTLALKIGQLKEFPESTLRLGCHIIPNLLDDSPTEIIKSNEQRIRLHSILETNGRKETKKKQYSHQEKEKHFPQQLIR